MKIDDNGYRVKMTSETEKERKLLWALYELVKVLTDDGKL